MVNGAGVIGHNWRQKDYTDFTDPGKAYRRTTLNLQISFDIGKSEGLSGVGDSKLREEGIKLKCFYKIELCYLVMRWVTVYQGVLR